MRRSGISLRILKSLGAALLIGIATALVFQLHGKALTAGLVDLIAVMLIAFRFGLIEAVISALAAAAWLDFFYMPPVFSLYEHDPQDWISSVVFVIVALTAGHFVTRLQTKAAKTELERVRLQRLYLMSRDIILVDARDDVLPQLSQLIAATFATSFVGIWDERAVVMERRGVSPIEDTEIKAICCGNTSIDHLAARKFGRTLRVGARAIGSLCLVGSETNDLLDPDSADAIASLASIALERSHSLIAESNAEAAKRSEQLRSTVLDGLAHAFKTPLATIQSASSGLLEIHRLDAPEAELVSIIDDQAFQLSRLTNQVLRTAKLDSSELTLRRERLAPEHIFQTLANEHGAGSADHPLRFLDDADGALAWGDLRLIKMSMEQLLDNAIKYSRTGTPIVVKATTTDSEVLLSVSNEGSFIPPEQQFRVFEKFYRAPGSEYRAAGTGIGLAIVKLIADAHKGRAWVESRSGGETTFYFALPKMGMEIR
jgi:two-component system, OmpR family, sensor histidine kinase KdpD